MAFDVSTVTEIVLVPIGIYASTIIKRYADGVLKVNDTLSEHTQSMSDLKVAMKQSDATSKIDSDSLRSEIRMLKEDLRSVQKSIEARTDNLEQGLKFVVSIRSDMDTLSGKVTRLDNEVNGLTVKADTQNKQMGTVAKILKELKK